MRRPGLAAELRQLLRLTATDPSAARSRIRRALGVLRARWTFRRCECGELVNVRGRVLVENRGRIELGDRVQFWPGMLPQDLACEEGAELTIGALSMFNYGVSIRAKRSIRIGKRCMFGSLVAIEDADGERVAPIVIQDDVWIGHRAIVNPGVTIGEGSVVTAGSVVSADVPPFSHAQGNPARCRPLPPSERHS
ncbi:MAG TPA: acyltransferase [Myxococcales bacterium]|nr:acyltransferase [Myxococcales bacterium]